MKKPSMFKISTVADKGAPTIETPWGTIYADTPQGQQYQQTKAVADALGRLIKGIQGMVMTKPQALDALAELERIAPVGERYLSEDMALLRQALESGKDFAEHIYSMEHGHLSRINFGLSCLAGSAPAPIRPETITKGDPRHPESPQNPSRVHRDDPRNYQ